MNEQLCRHEHTEDVALATGEVVALLCVDCLERLPLGWAGDFIEVVTFAGDVTLVPIPGVSRHSA